MTVELQTETRVVGRCRRGAIDVLRHGRVSDSMCDTAEWCTVTPSRVAYTSLTERVLRVRQAYTAFDQTVLLSSAL